MPKPYERSVKAGRALRIIRRRKGVGRTRSERGSTMLFVAFFVLPILFFGLVLCLDFIRYASDWRFVQNLVDQAALHAYRSLPYEDRAKAVAQAQVSLKQKQLKTLIQPSLTVTTTGDAVDVAFNGFHEPIFLSLIRAMSGAEKEDRKKGKVYPGFPLSARVQVSSEPAYVMIALDAGSYLAPQLEGAMNDDGAWGPLGTWPAAAYFTNNRHFRITTDNQNTIQLPPRILTQQCFNPAFSAVKEAALEIYRYFSQFSQDRVGVGVFPGVNWVLEPLRLVRSRSDKGAAPWTSDETPPAEAPEAAFTDYHQQFAADRFCAAVASGLVAAESAYTVPTTREGLKDWRPSSAPVEKPVFLETSGNVAWNPAYQTFTSTREALWSVAVRNGIADTRAVMSQALERVTAGAATQGTESSRHKYADRIVMIVAGAPPVIDGQLWNSDDTSSSYQGFRNSLTALRNHYIEDRAADTFRIKVRYVLFDTAEVPGRPTYVDLAKQLQTAANEALKDKNGVVDERFTFKVLYAPSPERLLSETLPFWLPGERNAVIMY